MGTLIIEILCLLIIYRVLWSKICMKSGEGLTFTCFQKELSIFFQFQLKLDPKISWVCVAIFDLNWSTWKIVKSKYFFLDFVASKLPLFSSSYLFTRLYSRVYDLLLYNTQQTDQIILVRFIDPHFDGIQPGTSSVTSRRANHWAMTTWWGCEQ